MDMFPENNEYIEELNRNVEAIENLQHSYAFEAVIDAHAIHNETTHIQGIRTTYTSDTLPSELTSNFYLPERGKFEIAGATLQENRGMWNFLCRVNFDEISFTISAQPGTCTVQTPGYDGEILTKRFGGEFVHDFLGALTLATIEHHNAGSPPIVARASAIDDIRRIQTLLEALGNINGLTQSQKIAAFEVTNSEESIEGLSSVERALFIKLASVESTTQSAVGTSLELGWQLFDEDATEMKLVKKESMHPTEASHTYGQRVPVKGTISDYVLRKQFGDLLPSDVPECNPRFISPSSDPVAWSHMATTFMKTLEPMMTEYAHLDY